MAKDSKTARKLTLLAGMPAALKNTTRTNTVNSIPAR